MAFLSDATPTTGAVVRVDLDEHEQTFLWARARRGGWATRLLTELSPGETINDATNSNAMGIAALSQSVEGLRNQLLTAEQSWRVSHEELHARLHRLQLETAQGTCGGSLSGGRARSLINFKTIVQDAFSGEEYRMA